MFIGSWLINLIISLIASFSVFIGSLSTNSLKTSSYRGGVTFIAFFFLTYFFRWLWMIAAKDTGESSEKNNVDKIDHGLKGKDTNSKPELSKEEVKIASQYVKDLVND